MIWILFSVQFLTLVAVWWTVIRDRKHDKEERGVSQQVAEILSKIMKQVTASYPTSGIWQVLRLNENGTWSAREWVRQGSIAWQEAHDAPGIVLRHGIEGEIVAGVQGEQFEEHIGTLKAGKAKIIEGAQ